jgi:hypothetical protein
VFPLHVLHVSIGFNMLCMSCPLHAFVMFLNNVPCFEGLISSIYYNDIIVPPLGHLDVSR